MVPQRRIETGEYLAGNTKIGKVRYDACPAKGRKAREYIDDVFDKADEM